MQKRSEESMQNGGEEEMQNRGARDAQEAKQPYKWLIKVSKSLLHCLTGLPITITLRISRA